MSNGLSQHQYLTLHAGGDDFAIPGSRVLAMVALQEFTPSETRPGLCGVVSLRNRSIPVIDLRAKLGLSPTVTDRRTMIVIADIMPKRLRVGLLVERLSQLFCFSETPEPRSDPPQWLTAIMLVKRRPKTIVDLDTMLGQSEVDDLIIAYPTALATR